MVAAAKRLSVLLPFVCVASSRVTQWVVEKSYKGLSCDEVCALVPLDEASCEQSELDLLKIDLESEDFLARFQLAGHSCSGIWNQCDDCPGGCGCDTHGSPFISTVPGEESFCKVRHAPGARLCSQTPTDGEDTRLCPCRGNTTFYSCVQSCGSCDDHEQVCLAGGSALREDCSANPCGCGGTCKTNQSTCPESGTCLAWEPCLDGPAVPCCTGGKLSSSRRAAAGRAELLIS